MHYTIIKLVSSTWTSGLLMLVTSISQQCLVTRTKISLAVHSHCLLVLQTCPDSDGQSFSLHFDCPLTKNRSIGNSGNVSGGRQRERERERERERLASQWNATNRDTAAAAAVAIVQHTCVHVCLTQLPEGGCGEGSYRVLCSDTALIYCCCGLSQC